MELNELSKEELNLVKHTIEFALKDKKFNDFFAGPLEKVVDKLEGVIINKCEARLELDQDELTYFINEIYKNSILNIEYDINVGVPGAETIYDKLNDLHTQLILSLPANRGNTKGSQNAVS